MISPLDGLVNVKSSTVIGEILQVKIYFYGELWFEFLPHMIFVEQFLEYTSVFGVELLVISAHSRASKDLIAEF